ncbi:MAG: ROK family protein [Candidatus Paceibacterota bacterium]
MFIGIDMGGTHTRIATASSLEKITFKDAVTFPTPLDFATGIEEMVSTIKSLSMSVDAIAIGVPGSVNDDGELIRSTNLPDWVNKPLQTTLDETFDCPVYIRNDAEMGAFGEAYFGEHAMMDFVYLTWGTGVGFAQVTCQSGVASVSQPEDKQPLHNLEEKIGGKSLESRFGKLAEDLTNAEWDVVLEDVSQCVPGLARHYSFTTMVVGGGVAISLCPRLAFEETLSKLDIKAALTKLGDQSGLYGAFSLMKAEGV